MSETFPIAFGPYELIDRLAVGGMAELFRARAPNGEPPGEFAVKRLLPHLAVESYYREMFMDEAALTARLRHPNIVHTYDYGAHEGQLFIAMELVDGLDGLSVLRECAIRQVRMPPEMAVYATQQVLAALAFAHAQTDDQGQPLGVVHRDISPANVLFAKRGAIKLADFGIAHAAQHKHHTKDGTLKGKYGYMSPEQVTGMALDARSDVFAAGVLLSEMLTGRRMFAASSELDVLLMVRDVDLTRLEKYGGHIGMDMQRILRKALKKNPGERFSSAAAFGEALGEWMYLHHRETTSMQVRELVTMLYEQAWARKRERTARLVEEMRELAMARVRALAEEARLVSTSGEVEIELDAMADAPPTPSYDFPVEPEPVLEKLGISMPTPADVSSGDSDAEAEAQSEGAQLGRIALTSKRIGVGFPVVEERDRNSRRDAEKAAGKTGQRVRAPHLHAGPGTLQTGEFPAVDHAQVGRDTLEMSSPMRLFEGEPSGQISIPRMATSRDPLLSPSVDFDESEISAVLDAEGAIPDVEAAGAVTMPSLGEIQSDPDKVGDFAEATPIAILFRLAVSHATGLLVASAGGVCKEIYIRQGVPEYVASNIASELFGEYLVHRGVLSEGELSAALAMTHHYGGKLGDTLVGLGLLQPLDVFRYLSLQLRQKLIDVCTWSKGTYRWYDGQENPRTAFPLDLDPFEVLGASVRVIPEQALGHWFAQIARQIPRVGKRHVRLERFRLGRAVGRVCDEMDGIRSVAELAGSHAEHGNGADWMRILYLLVQTGQVVLREPDKLTT